MDNEKKALFSFALLKRLNDKELFKPLNWRTFLTPYLVKFIIQ